MKISKDLLEKYNVPVPRYTSYPPANQFDTALNTVDLRQLIRDSNLWKPEHIGFYVHIPFCRKICFYCGCNACTIKNGEEVEKYVEAVKKEIRMVADGINRYRTVTQVHFGGGTPNAIPAEMISGIIDLIRQEFIVSETAELAIETNPAYLDTAYVDQLLEAGFNRFSFGVQDFNEDVLRMVNRAPGKIPIDQLISHVKKKKNNAAVNLDFIYGLPGQDTESFRRTMDMAGALQPDRLVTFSYAHVPWMKKHQQILEKRGLPGSEEKSSMFMAGYEVLTSKGYQHIGLDHFVKTSDELFKALSNNKLHRNFQGYCTRETTGQVYAFGVSAISQLEKAYIQNTKSLEKYISRLSEGLLPAENGIMVSNQQVIIREVITRLMCNKKLDLKNVADELKLDLPVLTSILDYEDSQLEELERDGLLNRSGKSLTVTDTGSLFIRNIAAVFDPAYRQQMNKYSKSI